MVRLSTLTPVVHVGCPEKNAKEIGVGIKELSDVDIILTPELSITGYSCSDLFNHEHLLYAAWESVLSLAKEFKALDQLYVVGCPVRTNGAIYNCAVVINQGQVIGIVPKQYPPNYKEFYEARHFAAGDILLPPKIEIYGRSYSFGIDLLFRSGSVVVGVEICEDLWVPTPPSSFMAVEGANLLLNLSASNETVGKSEYRTELVRQQSARCIAAYAYCSAGQNESTASVVFSGHNLVCENGSLLIESPQFEQRRHSQTIDIDVEKLNHDRSQTNSFAMCKKTLPHKYRYEEFYLSNTDRSNDLARYVPAMVFVPKESQSLDKRCQEVFEIQVCGLAKRLKSIGNANRKVSIGISGGLDSTLALLVACKAYDCLNLDRNNIQGLSLPGFGTSERTKENARRLAQTTNIDFTTIDIRKQSIAMFKDIKHHPFGIDWNALTGDNLVVQFQEWLMTNAIGKSDLLFENVQARVRTSILMNSGFVLGTGDMSELALGWCTYNADHMSMYNVNAGVPKTLVKCLVEWIADKEAKNLGNLSMNDILNDICETPISPELLPEAQHTEEILGPYELHDFFLYNFVRNGFYPEKIAYLAEKASGFSRKYKYEEIIIALQTFMNRFFNQQYKRQAIPDGPKVGSVDLNPRSDWRMPPDATSDLWTKFN